MSIEQCQAALIDVQTLATGVIGFLIAVAIICMVDIARSEK